MAQLCEGHEAGGREEAHGQGSAAASWNSPTRTRSATGSTAASSASRATAAGVIGRYSDRPDLFPNVQAFHTMRVNQPTGWFYNTEALRKLCDVWDKHGSGLTNMHGSTGRYHPARHDDGSSAALFRRSLRGRV